MPMKMKMKMMTKLLFSILLLSGLLGYACQSSEVEYEEHESGLEYRYIVRNENGQQAKPGDVLALDFKVYTDDSDSLVFDTRKLPRTFMTQLKEPSHPGGSFEDGLSLLNVGDSIHFLLDARNFYTHTRKMDKVPPFVKDGDKLRVQLKLRTTMSVEELAEERAALRHSNLQEEKRMRDEYLRRMNNEVAPTESGLYVVVEKEGQGRKAQINDRVKAHLTGKFLDGRVFYNTYELSRPASFVLNDKEIDIQGLIEGIEGHGAGAKLKLIIPSTLAYGKRQVNEIAPYSTLVFLVDILEVKPPATAVE